jgi:hypothetical protein
MALPGRLGTLREMLSCTLGSGASGGARSYGDNYIGVVREDLSISVN